MMMPPQTDAAAPVAPFYTQPMQTPTQSLPATSGYIQSVPLPQSAAQVPPVQEKSSSPKSSDSKSEPDYHKLQERIQKQKEKNARNQRQFRKRVRRHLLCALFYGCNAWHCLRVWAMRRTIVFCHVSKIISCFREQWLSTAKSRTIKHERNIFWAGFPHSECILSEQAKEKANRVEEQLHELSAKLAAMETEKHSLAARNKVLETALATAKSMPGRVPPRTRCMTTSRCTC